MIRSRLLTGLAVALVAGGVMVGAQGAVPEIAFDSNADLLRTLAGQRNQGGTSVVEFCIDTDGHVEDVRTKRSHGDREVDRVCREALSRWRFSPMAVRGKAQRTCSEMSFVIAFE